MRCALQLLSDLAQYSFTTSNSNEAMGCDFHNDTVYITRLAKPIYLKCNLSATSCIFKWAISRPPEQCMALILTTDEFKVTTYEIC